MTSPIPLKVKRSWKLENEKILGTTFVWVCHRQTKKGKKEALPPLYMLWKLISSDKIYNAVYRRSQLNESGWVIFQSNVN